MKSPRKLAIRLLWLVAFLLGRIPLAEAQAAGIHADPDGVVHAEDTRVFDFAEVCRRAKAAGLRGRLLDVERSMFAPGGVPSARGEATSLTEAILDRRRMAAESDQARAAATAFCTVRNLASQIPVIERIESLLAGVGHDMDAIEAVGGVAGVGRTDLERQANECGQRKLDLVSRLESERLSLAHLIDAAPTATMPLGDGPPVPEVVDVNEEINAAIGDHPDLAAIEMVRKRLRRDTLPVARRFLSLFDPAVGLTPPPGAVTGHGLRKTSVDTAPMELKLRSQQLEQLSRHRTDALRLEIGIAVRRFQAAQQQRELARLAVDRHVQRRDQLARSADGPGVTAIGLRLAEVDELSARQQLREADLRVELAYVHLLAARHAL